MRRMSANEVQAVVGRAKWATICAVDSSGRPYAIEATPFELDGDTCFMINPRGGVARCLNGNARVLLKYTLAAPDVSQWAGVSCQGVGRFDPAAEALRRGWAALGLRLGVDYSAQAERFAAGKRHSPLFRVRVEEMTGRCSPGWHDLLNR
ncbi:MAG: hypothetical protein V1797_15660 [Pseudomonadota bacterium]